MRPSRWGWRSSSFCPCPYPCLWEFQPPFLCQYLGGGLLKLPKEQKGLGPPLAAQTLGQLVQGERNWDLRARESLGRSRCFQAASNQNQQGPSNIEGLTLRYIAVVPSYNREFLYKFGLSLLHPSVYAACFLASAASLNSWAASLAF